MVRFQFYPSDGMQVPAPHELEPAHHCLLGSHRHHTRCYMRCFSFTTITVQCIVSAVTGSINPLIHLQTEGIKSEITKVKQQLQQPQNAAGSCPEVKPSVLPVLPCLVNLPVLLVYLCCLPVCAAYLCCFLSHLPVMVASAVSLCCFRVIFVSVACRCCLSALPIACFSVLLACLC